MTNWTNLVTKLNKAEKDVQEWSDGLKDAEKTLAAARAEMATALGMGGGGNGSKHKAAPAPLVKVAPKRARHDYQRKARILALLKAKGGFLTVDDVAAAERCTTHLAGHAMATLVKLGKMARVSRGRYSGPQAEAR